jgi:hypothetical protein
MPIFRIETGLGYYADVPGVAGLAMIRNLEARFGPLAFHDVAHTDETPARRWSRTSPQHVGKKTLARLFPPGFFAMSFAVVRHPAERMRAVYSFQRDVEGAIPKSTDFHDWLEDIAERTLDEPWVFDNAVRPRSDFVPDKATVFRVEDGPEPVAAWLDGLGEGAGPVPGFGDDPRAPELSDIDLDLISELYAADFARFGYAGGKPALRVRHSAAG